MHIERGIVNARRPTYLFSGLTKCGACGGSYNLFSRSMMRCFNASVRRTCTNQRSITKQELEGRVLRAIQERFCDPGAFEAFCAAFNDEMNRLRREHPTKLAALPREIDALNRRSKELLELLLQGFRDEAWKQELQTIEQRRAALEHARARMEAEPKVPALHPQMAEVLRQKTMQLASALGHADETQRASAR